MIKYKGKHMKGEFIQEAEVPNFRTHSFQMGHYKNICHEIYKSLQKIQKYKKKYEGEYLFYIDK